LPRLFKKLPVPDAGSLPVTPCVEASFSVAEPNDCGLRDSNPTGEHSSAVPVLYLDLGFLANLADRALRFVQIVQHFEETGRPTPAASTIERLTCCLSPPRVRGTLWELTSKEIATRSVGNLSRRNVALVGRFELPRVVERGIPPGRRRRVGEFGCRIPAGSAFERGRILNRPVVGDVRRLLLHPLRPRGLLHPLAEALDRVEAHLNLGASAREPIGREGIRRCISPWERCVGQECCGGRTEGHDGIRLSIKGSGAET
jgi:hypothetical protein